MKFTDVRERFVGRTKEIARFEEWLRNTDPETPPILYLYDSLTDENKKGGAGKTWLLRRFADKAKELFPDTVAVYVDFFNITDRDGVVVARRIMTELKEAYPEWDITNFEKSLAEYTNALQERKEDTSDQRNRLADAVIADLHTLDAQLSEANKRLLVFFDTYEVIQGNPLAAALRLEQAFPDDYDLSQMRFIIAGRFELDWNHPNWRGRKDEVITLPIAPFLPSEIIEYFEKVATVDIAIDPDDIQALYDLTEGRPILIGLVTDFLGQHIMKLNDLIEVHKTEFEASLVVKVNDLENPIAPIIWFMAHAYHRFNFALLDSILREAEFSDLLQDVQPEKIAQQLLRLSFVRHPSSGGEDFVLHDEMRPLVNRYCWDAQDPDRRSRKLLSKCVITYYENELQQVQSEQLRQAYIVEMLFHKLYIDMESGYNYFSEHFSKSINLLLRSFAHALLREAKIFEKQMSLIQRNNMKYGEARLLNKEESPALALPLFQALEQEADPQWLDGRKADLLFEKGVAYQELSRYSEAIESFTVGMELDKQRGHMSAYAYSLNRLGTVYQKQGRLDTALGYYEEGLKIHQDAHYERAIANDLLSISNVYRLQGKVEEASRRAKASLLIRSKLFKQGKISEVYVGTSLAAIGSIYYQINDSQKAEDFFQKALDIYLRTGYKKGLATIYNRLGKLSMDQGALYHSRQWFEKAYSTALGIDTESQINSLNKQGWLLVLEERYPRAIAMLQQAVELAKEVHDDYQQAESLVDLAEALHRSGLDEQAQQVRQQAREIGLKYSYNYLLGLSYESEGDVLYNNNSYKEAFSRYGEACYYMARYNDIEYRKRLRKVVDTLFEVPTEEISPIIDELVAYWSSQGADKDFPDFVSSCQEVKLLLGL